MISWNEIDKEKLRIAYQKGASLKVMAKLLERSPTAISKALSRFGIRPLGTSPRGVKKGIPPSGTLTCKQLQREFERYSESHLFIEKEESNFSKKKQLKDTLEPLSPFSSPQEWVSFDVVLQYLKKEGYHIASPSQKDLRGPSISQEFLLNQRFYRPEQVLMIANRVRFIHGLEPFLVEGITR